MTARFDDDSMLRRIALSIAEQTRIDKDAAGAKAACSWRVRRGVRVDSRWSVISELDRMESIVDELSDLAARRVAVIWCDSKAEATYSVSVRPGLWVPSLAQEVASAIVKVGSGHNGIDFWDGEIFGVGSVRLVDVNPDWNEPWMFDDEDARP